MSFYDDDDYYDRYDEDFGGGGLPITGTQLFGVGAAVGGYFLLRDWTTGDKQREQEYYQRTIEEIKVDMAYEMDNAGELPNSELQQHIADYKGKVAGLNASIPRGMRTDMGAFEDSLVGESYETKALAWKREALRLAYINLSETVEESVFDEIFAAMEEHWRVILLYGSAAIFIKSLLDWLKEGGGRGGLGTFRDFVEAGIIGAVGYLTDLKNDPEPGEEPSSEPVSTTPTGEPIVTGTPRAAADEAGVAIGTLLEILAAAGVGGAAVVSLGYNHLEEIASVIDGSVQWLVDNPAKAILLAVLLIAMGALAVADGPLPLGDAAAYTLAVSILPVIGVSLLDKKKAENVGQSLSV